MKHLVILSLIAVSMSLTACDPQMLAALPEPEVAERPIFPPSPTGSRVIVANRGEHTLSLIDVASEMVVEIVLEDGADPMYAQNPLYSDEIWVGTRGSDSVRVFDALRLRLKTEIPVGQGVFHMWNHAGLGQMWVVNDIDKTMSVIALESKEVLATVPIPEDLAEDYKPHDITVTETDAIVSLLGSEAEHGWLVKFSGTTFEEVGRLQVPADPHLMHWGLEHSQVYVASQAGKVLRVDPATLEITGELDISGAHGIWANEEETHLYVSDITSADGSASIYTIDLATFQIVDGSPVDAPLPFPHNMMVSIDNSKLFVTHSKDSDQTSIFDLDENGIPSGGRTVQTGATPFGIMLVRDPQSLK